MRVIILVILNLFLFSEIAESQISEKGIPYLILENKNIETYFIEIQAPNLNDLKSNNSKKLQFAKKIETDIAIKSKKNFYKTLDSVNIWKIGIYSHNALSLNLTLANFNLPEGAKLFVFTPDKKIVLGAFTHLNNSTSGILPIFPIQNDSLIIEYSELIHADSINSLYIKSIGYGFVDLQQALKSGQCNVDVACEDAMPWYTEKRAVAKMYIDNEFLCTGALINNTKNDETPYFLTANHCVSTENMANNTIFYFNYENKKCGENSVEYFQTLAGANLLATPENDNQIDFALLKLFTSVPHEYMPYFLGWSISDLPQNKGVSIHHPSGDVKKISISNKVILSDSYSGYITQTHWKIQSWDIGTTETGSSGAPLLNINNQIIGTLTGGTASCSAVNSPDYFSKFSAAWDYFPQANRQLKHWLNSDNLDINQWAAYEPYTPTEANNAGIVEILNTNKFICSQREFIPEIIIRNFSSQTLNSVIIKLNVDNELKDLTTWSGKLLPFESQKIVMNPIVLENGNHKLLFETSNPNGTSDVWNVNDTLSFNLEVKKANFFRLSLKTDNYGYETSWKIYDSKGKVLFFDDELLDNSNYSYDLCLEDSCSTFVLYDRAGDGLCCNYGNGQVEIFNENLKTVFIAENFQDSASFVFCDAQIIDDSLQVKIYPSPFERELNIQHTADENIQYDIFSIAGLKIISGEIFDKKTTLYLENLNDGIYFIKIYNNSDVVFISKILKTTPK